MVRCRQESRLVFLLLVGLCLPVLKATAQTVPRNTPATAATPQLSPKAHSRRKKAPPEPPVQQATAPPPTLAQSPPTPPQVSYNRGQLTIVAQNATLSQVLHSVQSLTGTSLEMPASASNERVVGQLGPGQPRDVLNSLLNGSKFNYIILGVTGDPGAVQKVILTTPKPASTVNTAQITPVQQPEEPDENYGEPEPEPTPLPPVTPPFRHRPNMPGRVPDGSVQPQPPQPQPQQPDTGSADNPQLNGGKTPEQLLQELQQMQQQQQQMQDQLNPANRQPQQQ
jgi:hypothetical protein